ncbi:MAG: TPM domain-containing protein [Bacteroidia bacterium]|nr:TPM domain-containing protein [Bacteroidia bacterium]
MKTSFFNHWLLLVIAIFSGSFLFDVHSQIPEKPNPPRLYNNFSKEFPNFLSPEEANAIEEKLEKFSRETSNQIAVVVVDDFGGYTAAEYATLLGEKWGIGKKGKDNGIVILIKPTGKKGERELFIAVGLGLEGAITDLATKKIRENIMQPLFAEGRFYEGLDKGLNALMQLAKGEISEKDLPDNDANSSAIIVFIIILIILYFVFKKNNAVVYTSGRRFYGGGGFYGGGSSWGSSSGSSGWSGFGGGSFGGGGSGGKW